MGAREMRGSAKQAGPETGVRERLLMAAAELFARKGYAATTVNEIVAAAGVTKPALYYYFINKEGIYLELMGDSLAKFDAMLDTALTAKGGAGERIVKLFDSLMELVLEKLQLTRIMYSIHYGPPQGAPFFDFDVFHFKLQDAVALLINEGIAAGEFRSENLTDMTWSVLGAVNIAIELELCHPELSLGREGLSRVLAIIFEGLRAKSHE